MTVAEIRGKISVTGKNLSERMEDLLTSDIFGCLRYLPPETALLPFLRTARSFRGRELQLNDTVVRAHSAFWPWLKSPDCIPCEPDLVLGLETEGCRVHLVAIEAKYFSDLSSEADEREEPNNQLARELDNLDAVTCAALGWDPRLLVTSRTLLFVTQDMGMPRASLARSLDEFLQKRGREEDIFWVSWRCLPSILGNRLAGETDPGHRAVLEDMLALLLRKGLTIFEGVDPVTERFMMSDFEFYQHAPRTYLWPDILQIVGTHCVSDFEFYQHAPRTYLWPDIPQVAGTHCKYSYREVCNG